MAIPNRFDLNLLGVFEAIYTHGGVSDAARHLSLSQPAISHSLAKLREGFSDRLFVREGNSFVPTATARAMIQPVREALRSIDIALVKANAFDPAASSRSFNLGLRPSGESPAFAGLVAHLLRKAPSINVASIYFSRANLPRALGNGDLDLALDVTRRDTGGIRSVALRPNHLVVVARDGHPELGEALSLEQYLAFDHIFVSPRAKGLGLEDAALAKLGRHRRIKVRCQNALTAWQIVGGSDLICTLPRSYAVALAAFGNHVLSPLPFPITSSELKLYWHEAADADPGVIWLRDSIESFFVEELT